MSQTYMGTRIRSIRVSQNLSQRALANASGISAPYLNLIEHNKRGIGGRTLFRLAQALDVDPLELSDGMETALINRVKKAAMSVDNLRVETDQSDAFAAQYPGFARLIARLQDRADEQENDFAALTDQMQNDAYVSQAIHLMLSSITAIRSTAEILADGIEMDRAQSRKFTDNLRSEALRLSQTANDILEYYEPNSDLETSTDLSAFEALLEKNGHYLADLENGHGDPAQIASDAQLSFDETKAFQASLESYAMMAAGLPMAVFEPAAVRLGFNPLALAEEFQTSLSAVFFRLAHMRTKTDQPRFALLQIDGAGAVVYRKQLARFALPRFGGACTLWPIYRSLAHAAQPIAAMLNMPFSERVFAISTAYPTTVGTLGVPPLHESIMIVTPDFDLLDPTLRSNLPDMDVGLQCTICPRTDCHARRSDYLLKQ